jgi:hypothetical protein
MKKTLKFLYLILSITSICSFIASCKKVEGEYEAPKFDYNTHIFSNASVDTVISSANDVTWWFDEFGLYINGEHTEFKEPKVKCWRDAAPIGADSAVGNIRKFESEWFVVEKLTSKSISISLKRNEGNKTRNLQFAISVGNGERIISLEQQP